MRSIDAPGPIARAWYRLVRGHLQIAGRMLLGCRTRGEASVPAQGPLLLVSNHQSHLDPVLAAVACPRRLRFIARGTLFVGPFGRLIDSLGAIPVDREGQALSGIKRTMQCLDAGEAVLVFPEGRRSENGELAPLKPGFLSLVRRRQPAIMVMAINGAFDAWPRHARWPRAQRVAVHFGQVILAPIYGQLSDDALLDLVAQEMQHCFREARLLRSATVPRRDSVFLTNSVGGNHLCRL
jgi:1-acyl-sn-glycerol-3-phosphate acyltransferase